MYQHKKCVMKFSLNLNISYRCPECWKYAPPIASGATFIVSPISIKMQWQAEVIKHINKDKFKVGLSSNVYLLE